MDACRHGRCMCDAAIKVFEAMRKAIRGHLEAQQQYDMLVREAAEMALRRSVEMADAIMEDTV